MKNAIAASIAILVLLVVGCSSTDPTASVESTTTTAVPITTTTTTSAPTTTTTDANTTVDDGMFELTKAADLEYQTPVDGWHAPLLDVYSPVEDGPWPVVVTYHGAMSEDTKSELSRLARHLAEHGAVVFNPTYGFGPRSSDSLRYYQGGQLGCIYSYVHENAVAFGGDPDNITLVGFSGGGIAAAATAMQAQAAIDGCAAAPTTIDPVSVILFEGDFALAPFWDRILESDPDLYEDTTVWRSIDAYDGAPLHFIVDAQTRLNPAYQVRADAVDGFLALRASADMRSDLEAIGALDDGHLDLTEASLLFDYRMQAAGHDSTVTWIDSKAHSLGFEAIDAITELVFMDPAQ